MFLRIEYVDKEQSVIYADEVIDLDDMFIEKNLFYTLRKQYGRCTGHVFIDDKHKRNTPIGWIFEKKRKYDDVNEYFIQQTWITLLKTRPYMKYEYINIKNIKGV